MKKYYKKARERYQKKDIFLKKKKKKGTIFSGTIRKSARRGKAKVS